VTAWAEKVKMDQETKAIFAHIDAKINPLSAKFEHRLTDTKILLGKLLSKLNSADEFNIPDIEFKVFSQFGDDGIIQYLIKKLAIEVDTFIEFGVENYNESNTRFLLQNNNWKGLVIDGAQSNIDYIKKSDNYWKHNLQAVCEFITAENINHIIRSAGITGEIGLLHVDIDGNDYWVWQAIDCVNPVIVILEYNSLFGPERKITIPYDPSFERFKAHHTGLYAGASLAALCELAAQKGYAFVGANSAGNNAYFIRLDKLSSLPSLSAEQGYVQSRFREHRDETGTLTFLPTDQAIETLRGLPVYNISSKQIEDF
jgi:hypothetical protein